MYMSEDMKRMKNAEKVWSLEAKLFRLAGGWLE